MTRDYLTHHGIPGQKWGVRRFQNEDGSYTEAGRARYGIAKQRYDAQRAIYKSAKMDARKANMEANSYSRRHPISQFTNKKVARSLNQKQRNAAMYTRASDEVKTLMEEAKKDYYNSDEFKQKIKKVATIAAVTAAAGATVYIAAKNKDTTIRILKSAGSKTVNALESSVKRVGNAMVDAALMSVGGIAITKLAQKLPVDDSVDEHTRNRNKVLYDTTKAGIEAATKANGNSNYTGKNNGAIGKEVSDRLGAPSNKGIDRQSSEYQNLFKDANGNQRDSSVRSVIKSLASSGYDIDQLKEYVKGVDNGTIRHSFEDAGFFMVASLIKSNGIVY